MPEIGTKVRYINRAASNVLGVYEGVISLPETHEIYHVVRYGYVE